MISILLDTIMYERRYCLKNDKECISEACTIIKSFQIVSNFFVQIQLYFKSLGILQVQG